jgi:S1-C subfamily serine protease
MKTAALLCASLAVATPLFAGQFPSDQMPVNVESSQRIDGYKLSNVEPGSTYEKLGLKNGDIVQEVNGKLPTQQELLEGFDLSKNQGKDFVLKIKRDGKPVQLHYHVKTEGDRP